MFAKFLVVRRLIVSFTRIVCSIVNVHTAGVNGSAYCTNATAQLYADFLTDLVVGMHAHNKRVAICIEMGCLLGPEYWELYASTGVDSMMSMGSTYYNNGTYMSL